MKTNTRHALNGKWIVQLIRMASFQLSIVELYKMSQWDYMSYSVKLHWFAY